MRSPAKRRYTATATTLFPKVEMFLEPILASIATHDITVRRLGGRFELRSPYGVGFLEAAAGQLRLSVETDNRHALNRLKHALVGPISFIAASEALHFEWTGDEAGPTPLEDLRILRVRQTMLLTPNMLRIVFEGEDLSRFDRTDQLHCRLIFQPKDVETPEWPSIDDRGHIVWPQQRKLDTRVYTIRSIDTRNGEITIDFALHDHAGPATRWAMDASAGDLVGIVGPAADGPRPAGFYVLAGDETGLPGIARILENLDGHAQGFAFVEIGGPNEKLPLVHPAAIQLQWLDRQGARPGTTSLLADAVRSVEWPSQLQEAFFWGGCEHKAFRQIHRYLRNEVCLPRERQVFHSFWHRKLSEEQIIAAGASAYLPD
ncbi:hypothetical protein MAUB1S_08009 [Mycolicibacterium aubagnense]